MVIARSYLYVPGNRPERFDKALASGSDAVIFDLEDAVPVALKDGALASVVAALGSGVQSRVERWVRINAGARGLDDLRAVASLSGLRGVIVPKATPDSLAEICTLAVNLPIGALIESAVGVLRIAEIAGLTGVDQLVLGEVDLVADLGMSASPEWHELDSIRIGAVVVSAALGCRPPIGPVWTDIRDLEGLRVSTESLRRLGFSGRQAIHPNQVDIINTAMSPSVEERERAAHVLELARRSDGGVCVDEDGRMIDEAVLRSARRIFGSPTGV